MGASSVDSAGYVGDFDPGESITLLFTTVAPTTGVPTDPAGSPVVSCYKNGSTAETTTGVTGFFTGLDGRTGLNRIIVDTSADGTFYSAGASFYLVFTAGTVGGVSVVGTVVAHFTLRRMKANVWAISGDDVAADRLETMLDGTGGNTLSLGKLSIVAPAGDVNAVTISASGTAAAVSVVNSSALGANAHAMLLQSTNAFGLYASGNAAGISGAGTNGLLQGNLYGDITGNLSGSVGSVTGAVGSVTGNVGGNVTGSVGSVATGGIAAASFAAGAINAAAIATDAIGSDELAASAITEIQSGLATAAALAIIDDFLDTEVAAILGVTNKLDTALELDGAVYRYTTNALEQAPTGGSAPTVGEIADAVWDEARAGHVAAGSFGEGVASVQGNVTGSVASVTGNVGGTIAGFTLAAKAEIQQEAEDALAAYDPPTNTEMEARTIVAANYATAANLATVASYLDTEILAILEDTGTTIPAQIAALNNLSAAQVNAEVDTALADINLDHLVKIAVDTDWATTVHLNSVLGHIADNGTTATFDRTTDSLEAVRDRGDAAWTTATGFSTHSAADVWAVATRVLTAGDNIVLAKGTGVTGFTDISAAQVNSEVDTALADYDGPTHAELVSEINSVQVDIAALNNISTAQVNSEVDTALADVGLTVTRTGYLDKLNISGNVASSSEVTAIQNNTRVVRVVPEVIERPDSGTTTYRVELLLYDTTGNMEAPDAAPTIALVNQAGTDRSSRLDSTTMALVSTGRYRAVYTADAADTLEQLVWTFSVVEGGATRLYGNGSLVVDTSAVDFTAADRTKLDTLHDTRLTAGRAAALDYLDANITSRAPAASALSTADWTSTRALALDNLDATVSSRAPSATALSTVQWTNVRAALLDNLDAAVSTRAPAATALSTVQWTNTRAGLLDNLANLDTTISSRASAADLATVAGYIDTEVAAIKAKTDLIPASPAAVGSAMTLANGAITDATVTVPAEAAGRPTTALGMLRRLFEWAANKRTRDRITGNVLLRNAADDATLETQVQSTSGDVDTQTKGV